MAHTDTDRNDFLAGIAVEIIRENIKNGNDPMLAIAPYAGEALEVIARRLTHSEKKLCGFDVPDRDPVELALRVKAENRELTALRVPHCSYDKLLGHPEALDIYCKL